MVSKVEEKTADVVEALCSVKAWLNILLIYSATSTIKGTGRCHEDLADVR